MHTKMVVAIIGPEKFEHVKKVLEEKSIVAMTVKGQKRIMFHSYI